MSFSDSYESINVQICHPVCFPSPWLRGSWHHQRGGWATQIIISAISSFCSLSVRPSVCSVIDHPSVSVDGRLTHSLSTSPSDMTQESIQHIQILVMSACKTMQDCCWTTLDARGFAILSGASYVLGLTRQWTEPNEGTMMSVCFGKLCRFAMRCLVSFKASFIVVSFLPFHAARWWSNVSRVSKERARANLLNQGENECFE